VPPVWEGSGDITAMIDPEPVRQFVEQPPAEHTTRDPWPDGFEIPNVVAKLKAMAEATGWEARVGYSRAFEKRGRGKVGGEGDARWVWRQYVGLQVRRPVHDWLLRVVVYGADAEAEALKWTVFSAWVDGRESGILAFRKMIKEKADG
jgi:hypothetical protein